MSQGDGPDFTAPHDGTGGGASSAPRRNRRIFGPGLLAAALLAIVLPFLAASQTSFNKLVNSWFEGCRIVIEKEQRIVDAESGVPRIPVRLYVVGENTPSRLRLVFSTKKTVLRSVELKRGSLKENLTVHPQADKICPKGGLCAEEPTGGLPKGNMSYYSDIAIDLKPVSEAFAYEFVVQLDNVAFDVSDLDVYVHVSENVTGPYCAAEATSPFNYLARVGQWGRFFVLLVLVVILTVIVAAARAARGKKEESE